MSSPRRFEIYGGPGTGKSTFAAKLYAVLKEHHATVELVPEAIKEWAWLNQSPKAYDQVFLLATNLSRMARLLDQNVSVISDSPPTLTLAYVERDYPDLLACCTALVRAFNHQYPQSTSIFLPRNVPYQAAGRYENLSEARCLDQRICTILQNHEIPYYRVDPRNPDSIINALAEGLL